MQEMSLIDELLKMAERLETFADKLDEKTVGGPIDRLEKTCNKFSKSASGSWFGYHANVYYLNFQPPPPGAYFSVEFGFNESYSMPCTEGEWCQYSPDDVREAILSAAGITDDLYGMRRVARNTRKEVEEIRRGMMSILSRLTQANPTDLFLSECRDQIQKIEFLSAPKLISVLQSRIPTFTRDSLAATSGLIVPPHLRVFADMVEVKSVYSTAGELATMARSLAEHFGRASLPVPVVSESPRLKDAESKPGHTIHIGGDVHGGVQINSPHAAQNDSAKLDAEKSALTLKQAILSSSLTPLEKEEAVLALDRILVLSKRPRTPETVAAISSKSEIVKSIAANAGKIVIEAVMKNIDVFTLLRP